MQLQLHFITQHYTTLITLHYNYNCNYNFIYKCNYNYITQDYATLRKLHCTTNTTATTLH